jgi:hypothetical protein
VIVVIYSFDLQPITTEVVSSNPAPDEVYIIISLNLSGTCGRSMVFSGHSCYLHQ